MGKAAPTADPTSPYLRLSFTVRLLHSIGSAYRKRSHNWSSNITTKTWLGKLRIGLMGISTWPWAIATLTVRDLVELEIPYHLRMPTTPRQPLYRVVRR